MLFKGLPPSVLLEHVEQSRIVRIPRDTVLKCPGLRLRELVRLRVDGFQCICVLGMSVYLGIRVSRSLKPSMVKSVIIPCHIRRTRLRGLLGR